jgi:hypothetical protein
MAFDGFVINGHLHPNSSQVDAIIDLTCSLLLGQDVGSRTEQAQGPRDTGRRQVQGDAVGK